MLSSETKTGLLSMSVWSGRRSWIETTSGWNVGTTTKEKKMSSFVLFTYIACVNICCSQSSLEGKRKRKRTFRINHWCNSLLARVNYNWNVLKFNDDAYSFVLMELFSFQNGLFSFLSFLLYSIYIYKYLIAYGIHFRKERHGTRKTKKHLKHK